MTDEPSQPSVRAALEAVLREVRAETVDLLLVGGDVLPGPMPRETLDCLLGLDIPVRFIRGNGDRVVLGHANRTMRQKV